MPEDMTRLPSELTTYFDRSNVALALSPADTEDHALSLVNAAFLRLTGYVRDDIIGRNCRFLQGDETSSEDKQRLHDFVHDDAQDDGRFPILNLRKDGSRFYNFVFMTRLRDADGVARFLLASQFDLTAAVDRIRLQENDQALQRSLSDIDRIGREYGLTMLSSARTLAGSVATLARLSMRDVRL